MTEKHRRAEREVLARDLRNLANRIEAGELREPLGIHAKIECTRHGLNVLGRKARGYCQTWWLNLQIEPGPVKR
jgi:hypothetical protein